MKKVVTRFAPSPTGTLHIGGVRTALFNYVYAKKYDGLFLVRIEDTDTLRSKDKFTEQICQSMKWLGLDWDDELIFQSKRTDLYLAAIQTLLESGQAYRCFASKDGLKLKLIKADRQDLKEHEARLLDIEERNSVKTLWREIH